MVLFCMTIIYYFYILIVNKLYLMFVCVYGQIVILIVFVFVLSAVEQTSSVLVLMWTDAPGFYSLLNMNWVVFSINIC